MVDPLPRAILKERFAQWYRSVSIDLTGELLLARRQSVEKMAQTLNVKSAPTVVAYAHGRKTWGPALIDWIRQCGTEFDENFRAGPGDLEPRVMAACAVAHRLVTTPTNPVSVSLSLLIHCAAFRGFATSARSQDLIGLATHQLEVATDRDKAHLETSDPSMVTTVNSLFEELGEPPEWGGEPVGGSSVAPWVKALHSGLKELAGRIDGVERSLVKNSAVTREELNQVAWLLDDYCELGGGPWEGMKEAAIIIAGTELAAITESPSPTTSAVMLRGALLKAGEDPTSSMKPLDAVARAGKYLDEVWPEGTGHELLPLSAAIDAWREKGRGRGTWRTLAQENRRGGALPAKPAGDLADQSYREFLVSKLRANA